MNVNIVKASIGPLLIFVSFIKDLSHVYIDRRLIENIQNKMNINIIYIQTCSLVAGVLRSFWILPHSSSEMGSMILAQKWPHSTTWKQSSQGNNWKIEIYHLINFKGILNKMCVCVFCACVCQACKSDQWNQGPNCIDI